jgi:hypothetical protein
MGKDDRENFFFLNFFFFGQKEKLLTWIFPKKFFDFCGVFELPLLRNAQKRHKTKLKKFCQLDVRRRIRQR